MCVGEKSSCIAPEASSVPSKASPSIATDASITVTIGGELVSIIEPVAVGVGEVSIGVAVREAVSLGDAHDTQASKLVYKRERD